MMAGIVLELSQFPTKAEVSQITPAMEDSLIIHYIPVSLGLWIVGALFLLFYPITEDQHRENVERLKAREAQAREQTIRDGAFGSPAR